MPEQDFFATSPGGLEGLLAAELTALGAEEVAEQRGGVRFRGELVTAYRACLWSRVANRVLLPVARFSAADGNALYAGARGVDWMALMQPGMSIAVDFGGMHPAVEHTHYGSLRVKDAVVDGCREASGERPDVDVEQPGFRINAHQVGEAVTLAIDLSGGSLHKRGYRRAGVGAPLKENLAAAMLLRAEWPALAGEGGGMVDPLCGSGTLLIEAALMAGDVAPGLLREHWGFQGWTGHDAGSWRQLEDEARERRHRGLPRLPPIVGYDHDAQAVRTALASIEAAGLVGRVHVERRELGDAEPPRKGCRPGLVATNPPYGERIGSHRSLSPLYARLGELLRERFPGWRAIILNGAGLEVGLKPERSWMVRNGPIQCRLERFAINESDSGRLVDEAASLVNRVRKNQRRLKSWRKRAGVDCYRLYDADIPEYALAVDRYETLEEGPWLHVQEYAPPPSVDQRDAARRLRTALAALPDATGVSAQQVAFKVRQRQRGPTQYQRQGESGRLYTVMEHGARVLVNFTDYLDTGLFLDHRPVREWIAANAAGATFLNLFAYTGVATVHAARGGALATTSVDLSTTYVDWTRRNLEANGYAQGRAHRLVRADCLKWLREAVHSGGQDYDLILLDPPSFSNSKRMQETLDIQRDHAQLIALAARLLSEHGVLIFSSNRRRFRLDEAALGGLRAQDCSEWSTPPDFQRNPGIHRCWFIRR